MCLLTNSDFDGQRLSGEESGSQTIQQKAFEVLAAPVLVARHL